MNPNFLQPGSASSSSSVPDAYSAVANGLTVPQNLAGFGQNQLLAALMAQNSQSFTGQPAGNPLWLTQQPQPQQQPPQQQPPQQQQQQQAQQPSSSNNMQNAMMTSFNPIQAFQQAFSGAGITAAGINPLNLLSDVLRFSTPIGQSPNDEDVLIAALRACPGNGLTYRQVLESLHGVNNHAANLWKDYYLEHKFRIDKRLSEQSDGPARTVKKPSNFASMFSSSAPPRDRDNVKLKKEKPFRRASHHAPTTSASSTGRLTMNSVSASLPPDMFSDAELPEPPSREPSPPTEVVKSTKGYKFTDEDTDFMIKFVAWELQCDPAATKSQICDKLGTKASHHSSASWRSHWSRAPTVEKLFDIAQIIKKRSGIAPRDYEPAVEELEGGSEDDEEHEQDDAEYAPSNYSSDLQSTEDEGQMGAPGDSFTLTDERLVAKWIAGHTNWAATSSRDRWMSFSRKYPQRSDKAWAEYYRRNENALLSRAKRYRKRSRKRLASQQRGQPSWASSPMKRKSTDSSAGPSNSPYTRIAKDERKRLRV